MGMGLSLGVSVWTSWLHFLPLFNGLLVNPTCTVLPVAIVVLKLFACLQLRKPQLVFCQQYQDTCIWK